MRDVSVIFVYQECKPDMTRRGRLYIDKSAITLYAGLHSTGKKGRRIIVGAAYCAAQRYSWYYHQKPTGYQLHHQIPLRALVESWWELTYGYRDTLDIICTRRHKWGTVYQFSEPVARDFSAFHDAAIGYFQQFTNISVVYIKEDDHCQFHKAFQELADPAEWGRYWHNRLVSSSVWWRPRRRGNS